MYSATSKMDASLLSPVSSPVPQVRHHTSTNLTGDTRKVRDLAADFHNMMLKWESLNVEGIHIISRISNIKIAKVFDVPEQESELEIERLPQELSPLCDLLCSIVETMSKIEAKMHHKAKMTDGLESLQQFQKSSTEHSILFSTMTLHDVAHTLNIIHRTFEEELKLKKELCRQIAHADSRQVVMFYCACWMHQPYLPPGCHDLLQALLIETAHVK